MPAREKVIADILQHEGYSSEEDFARDMALWLTLAREEQYQAECRLFEEQYGMTTSDFEQLAYSKMMELLSEEHIKS